MSKVAVLTNDLQYKFTYKITKSPKEFVLNDGVSLGQIVVAASVIKSKG